jgi:hypothetical protein
MTWSLGLVAHRRAREIRRLEFILRGRQQSVVDGIVRMSSARDLFRQESLLISPGGLDKSRMDARSSVLRRTGTPLFVPLCP